VGSHAGHQFVFLWMMFAGCHAGLLLAVDACSGTNKDTRGTAYVVYEDIYDAKNACDHLSGFNVANRYLIVLYYNPQVCGLLTASPCMLGAVAGAGTCLLYLVILSQDS
jgi:hypothetical protein